jgi:hypothetical protein
MAGYVTITDNYRVIVESNCLTLQKRSVSKAGKESWGDSRYYDKWEEIFSAIVKDITAGKVEGNVVEMKELRKIILDTKAEIRELLADYEV